MTEQDASGLGAETLQDILRPEFRRDVVEMIRQRDALPVLIEPAFLTVPTYDIPRRLTDEQTILSVINSSVALAAGARQLTLCRRGGGKFYLHLSES